MNDITISCTHDKTPDAARAAAERMAEKLKAKFDLECAWDGDQMRFRRPGVSGELTLSGQDAVLNIRLGLVLSALKPTIEREATAYLNENFSA